MSDSATEKAAASPHFAGLPAETLADESVRVRLEGVAPGTRVTIRSRMRDDSGVWWEAANLFLADEHGVIDLAAQAPEAGSYTGVEPMGFLWSMTPTESESASPMMIGTIEPKIVELTAEIAGEPVSDARLVRTYVAPGVRRVDVRDDGLYGTFFSPAGSGPFPAIILLSGSGGGLSEPQAALYAAHGYAALALAYFRAGHLPNDLIRIPLEYFARAIAWLEARPEVDAGRLAVGGASRGGELSLLLASRFPQFKAVVANVPSAIVYGGVGSDEKSYLEPAWTQNGESIPYFTSAREDYAGPPPEPGVPFALTPIFLRGLEEEERVQQAAIPVEQINGPVLLISGRDDAMWPSSRYSEMVMARLAEHHHPYPDQHLDYEGTGHIIGQPWAPTTVFASVHPVAKTVFAYGGAAKGSADARADAWPKILAFLDANLKERGSGSSS